MNPLMDPIHGEIIGAEFQPEDVRDGRIVIRVAVAATERVAKARVVIVEAFDPLLYRTVSVDEIPPVDLSGVVRDTGGGIVTLVVGRDTESYPADGQRVEVRYVGGAADDA